MVYCPCTSGHYAGWKQSLRAGEQQTPHPLNRRGKRLDQSEPCPGVFQRRRNATDRVRPITAVEPRDVIAPANHRPPNT